MSPHTPARDWWPCCEPRPWRILVHELPFVTRGYARVVWQRRLANKSEPGTCWEPCTYHTGNLEIEGCELNCSGLAFMQWSIFGCLACCGATLQCIPLYQYHLDIPNFGSSRFRDLLNMMWPSNEAKLGERTEEVSLSFSPSKNPQDTIDSRRVLGTFSHANNNRIGNYLLGTSYKGNNA